ncbi:MAG: hypothetical protein VCA38_14785 [Roseibacillus sp.]|jgi:hypothetical protein
MSAEPPQDDFTYSPHALRLSGREWLVVLGLVLGFAFFAPRFWNSAELFEPVADHRVPYELSNDYWHYERRLQSAAADKRSIFVIGDSVVWGEYVKPDGTLSHFLNTESGGEHQFTNAGLNGLFPLALEGLVRDFGHPIKNRRVILHANLLWMTSPEADLSAGKEQAFNHQPLVPQFPVSIPSYRASVDRRLSHLANRKVGLFAWSKHLQIAYFDQMSIPEWTMAEGNARKNPLAQLTGILPREPADDPDRGEASSRHKSWSDGTGKAQDFPWVAPEDSLQLAALKRLATLLLDRRNNLVVVIGPLNEHMIAASNRPAYEELRRDLVDWLRHHGIPHYLPVLLPTELYGDASHPLTAGYEQLAKEIFESPGFSTWLE